MGVLEDIAAKYPSLAFLANDPEIGPLLAQAVDPNMGFSPETFRAKLYETNWWKNTSEAGRNKIIKEHTDPASATDDRKNFQADLRRQATAMGLNLSWAEQDWLAALGQGMGFAPDSQRMREELVGLSERQNHEFAWGKGEIGVAARQAADLLRENWFQDINLQQSLQMGKEIVLGWDSLESINARYQTQAAGLFPWLKERISSGETLGQIAQPYRELAATELELASPEQVPMGYTEWMEFIQYRDPNNGEMRVMDMNEATYKVRNRDSWWQTSKGQEQDATMTQAMLQTFGQRV